MHQLQQFQWVLNKLLLRLICLARATIRAANTWTKCSSTVPAIRQQANEDSTVDFLNLVELPTTVWRTIFWAGFFWRRISKKGKERRKGWQEFRLLCQCPSPMSNSYYHTHHIHHITLLSLLSTRYIILYCILLFCLLFSLRYYISHYHIAFSYCTYLVAFAMSSFILEFNHVLILLWRDFR